ncbi:MAG: sn-glycerol-3-phosphate ABC transporter ATP-binding protein UgpC [Gemmatimonadetes bacterium]|uniref:Sn-glycerol-3-phosphate ABC transporter ATP-binding protein UgpC n=1 Tax=Candidatus Kutchimonas denitrificans TaxID=3056748 RepID=A0AAE4Z6R2_9BACT|nr:sn-glycerol-3-phosphate ABC transporter ATP-binding protein UgpC [Gemmatimonadota bacterium]NIR74038.1 sn-glycerol-3-phosphate ABC transporter ATP-binding protein UgpC [Candidatus Kutchimonas denitrificans]NIS03027.1 sn-glycerol-3-phosphate ABC transporter ATP-binding protein UgpC [Gemmatimonadota bacterium]NIT68744.1 sn-glycerol-3-phosphate ABC transporter ATP-binding protein UgpC [Gemmatimonadota bacterium]NIU53325.1 sn-glycerol-3-phosphate ABC transporter ATP-binding protein UgpC [Gemmati
MASVTLENVGKTYPNGQVAARDMDLAIQDGELVVLVGPSGCGKSTTLRMVAGLETPTAGRILIGGKDVTATPPQDRDIAMVFQTYALYPHKTVRDNLAFGLRMRRLAADEIGRRVREAARTLGLEELLDRKPAQLSGGQRQRVALGRAIVREPKAFLLDEPLSNLDAKLRLQTRAELARIHKQLGATMLYVTHDQEEAMTLGDRVAVLEDGRLQQVASPAEVYRRPANVFVAGFIGSPAMNLFRGLLQTDDEGPRFESSGCTLTSGVGTIPGRSGPAILGVRPPDIELCDRESADLSARVEVIELLGSAILVHLRATAAEEQTIRAVGPEDWEVAEDEVIGVRFNRERLHFFDGDGGRRLN